MSTEIPVYVPQHFPGDPEHWLQRPAHQWFRDGWNYAFTQTHAIPAMAKCSPTELYWFAWAVLRGAGIADPEGVSGPEQGAAGGDNVAELARLLHASEDWGGGAADCEMCMDTAKYLDAQGVRAALRSAPPTTEGT